MGCDIHMYAEVPFESGFTALSDGQFFIPRDYSLFSALAGVRSRSGFAPLFAPRGIPAGLSGEIAARYYSPIMTAETAAEWRVGDYTTPEEAEDFIASGNASRLPGDSDIVPLMSSTHGYVSHPDYHTPSWLRIEELFLALEHAVYSPADGSREFAIFCEYMDIARRVFGADARIVFWFDN